MRPSTLLLKTMNLLLVPRSVEELQSLLAPLSERGVYRYLKKLREAGVRVFTPRRGESNFRHSLLPLDRRIRAIHFCYDEKGNLAKILVITRDPRPQQEDREPSEKLEGFSPEEFLFAFFKKE